MEQTSLVGNGYFIGTRMEGSAYCFCPAVFDSEGRLVEVVLGMNMVTTPKAMFDAGAKRLWAVDSFETFDNLAEIER